MAVNPDLFPDWKPHQKATGDPLFDSWWSLYLEGLSPVPVRDKQACAEYWRRQKWTVVQQKALIVKLGLQIDFRASAKSRNQFCPRLPDPIRYLKRKLWKEELPE